MITQVAITNHEQVPSWLQVLRGLLKQPQGNMITDHAALVERWIQKDQLESARTDINAIAVGKERAGLRESLFDIMSGTEHSVA